MSHNNRNRPTSPCISNWAASIYLPPVRLASLVCRTLNPKGFLVRLSQEPRIAAPPTPRLGQRDVLQGVLIETAIGSALAPERFKRRNMLTSNSEHTVQTSRARRIRTPARHIGRRDGNGGFEDPSCGLRLLPLLIDSPQIVSVVPALEICTGRLGFHALRSKVSPLIASRNNQQEGWEPWVTS